MFERLETLEELILAGTREAGARNNFAQQVIYRSTLITFKAVRLCSPVSLSLQSALYKHKFYHNFSPQNNGAHVKVIQQ